MRNMLTDDVVTTFEYNFAITSHLSVCLSVSLSVCMLCLTYGRIYGPIRTKLCKVTEGALLME